MDFDYKSLDGVNGHYLKDGKLMVSESDRMSPNDWKDLYNRIFDIVNVEIEKSKEKRPELETPIWDKMKEVHVEMEDIRKNFPYVTRTFMNEAVTQWQELVNKNPKCL